MEKCSYNQEFDSAWKKQRDFLNLLGFNVDAAILFGSIAYGYPRLINKNKMIAETNTMLNRNPKSIDHEATMAINNLPESALASDIDIFVLSENYSNAANKIRVAGIPFERPALFGLGNLRRYELGIPELSRIMNISISGAFSEHMPFAEIYIGDSIDYKNDIRNLVLASTGETQTDIDAMFKATALIQALRFGVNIEGDFPEELKRLSEKAFSNFGEYRSKHPEILENYNPREIF